LALFIRQRIAYLLNRCAARDTQRLGDEVEFLRWVHARREIARQLQFERVVYAAACDHHAPKPELSEPGLAARLGPAIEPMTYITVGVRHG
jgi:hypothetical protein